MTFSSVCSLELVFMEEPLGHASVSLDSQLHTIIRIPKVVSTGLRGGKRWWGGTPEKSSCLGLALRSGFSLPGRSKMGGAKKRALAGSHDTSTKPGALGLSRRPAQNAFSKDRKRGEGYDLGEKSGGGKRKSSKRVKSMWAHIEVQLPPFGREGTTRFQREK